MIRRTIERLSRGRKLRRTLPNGVRFYVSPDSQLKYLKRAFDTDLVELAAVYVSPHSVVWDIGANCGVFAFLSAHAKNIVAVEADPFLANLLQQSVALSGVPLTIVPAAVYSSVGLASFSIAMRGRASNHLTVAGGRSQTGGERARLMVPTLRLDDLLDHFGSPTIVKIDVEGAELEVLRGATKLLRDARPILYIEVGDEAAADCRAILEDAAYSISIAAELNWLAVPQGKPAKAKAAAAELQTIP